MAERTGFGVRTDYRDVVLVDEREPQPGFDDRQTSLNLQQLFMIFTDDHQSRQCYRL
jgi:hypothetical protein